MNCNCNDWWDMPWWWLLFEIGVVIGVFSVAGLILYLLDQYVFGSNSTNITQLNLDCVRMFYSDTWNKGYVIDLAKFCEDTR